MRLFFLRHGQADHNRLFLTNESNRRVSNLTAQGRQEVLESADEFKDIPFNIIYSSPLQRCQQTAGIIKEHQANRNLQIKIDKRLSEFKTGFDNRLALIWFIRLFLARNKLTKKFKGGQSITELAAGIEAFWQDIHAEHLQQNALIVAHLITYQMFCHLLYNADLKVPWRQTFYLPTAGWHEFQPKSRK